MLNMVCVRPFKRHGCGQCKPCRINKRRELVCRILSESLFHENSTFLTLTLDDAKKDSPYGVKYGDYTFLNKGYVQTWLNRFRMRVSPTRIRYFLVGEYGTDKLRPHYHAILFGWPPCKTRQLNIFRNENRSCDCDSCLPIDSTWALGKVTLDEVSPDSAAYVAGYVVDKFDELPGFESWRINSDGLGAQIVPFILNNKDVNLETRFSTIKMFGKELPLGRYLKEKLKNVQMQEVEEKEELRRSAILAEEAFFERLAAKTEEFRKFQEEVVREGNLIRMSRWEWDRKQQRIINKLATNKVFEKRKGIL